MARFGPSRKNIVPQQPVSRGPLIAGLENPDRYSSRDSSLQAKPVVRYMTVISTFGYNTYVTFGHLCSVTIFVFLVLLVKCPLLKKKKYSMFGITV